MKLVLVYADRNVSEQLLEDRFSSLEKWSWYHNHKQYAHVHTWSLMHLIYNPEVSSCVSLPPSETCIYTIIAGTVRWPTAELCKPKCDGLPHLPPSLSNPCSVTRCTNIPASNVNYWIWRKEGEGLFSRSLNQTRVKELICVCTADSSTPCLCWFLSILFILHSFVSQYFIFFSFAESFRLFYYLFDLRRNQNELNVHLFVVSLSLSLQFPALCTMLFTNAYGFPPEFSLRHTRMSQASLWPVKILYKLLF